MTPAAPQAIGWAMILAGGRGRRLGFVDKAAVEIHGQSLLASAFDAVDGCPRILVIGPPRTFVDTGGINVQFIQEDPPGGGPAAAIAAGATELSLQETGATLGVILAVDQVGVSRETITRLLTEASSRDTSAVLTAQRRRHYTVGVYREPDLATALKHKESWHDESLRSLFAPMSTVDVPARSAEGRDIDTPQDLQWWRDR